MIDVGLLNSHEESNTMLSLLVGRMKAERKKPCRPQRIQHNIYISYTERIQYEIQFSYIYIYIYIDPREG